MRQKRYFPTTPSRRFYTNIHFLFKNKDIFANLLTSIKKTKKNKSLKGNFVIKGVHKKKKRPYISTLINVIRNVYY